MKKIETISLSRKRDIQKVCVFLTSILFERHQYTFHIEKVETIFCFHAITTFANVWHTHNLQEIAQALQSVYYRLVSCWKSSVLKSLIFKWRSWNHFAFTPLWRSIGVYYLLVSCLEGISTHFQMKKVETILLSRIMTFANVWHTDNLQQLHSATKCVIETIHKRFKVYSPQLSSLVVILFKWRKLNLPQEPKFKQVLETQGNPNLIKPNYERLSLVMATCGYGGFVLLFFLGRKLKKLFET